MDKSMHRNIDRICDRFEEAWKTGKAPRIEQFLGDATFLETDSQRSTLLGELVIIDLECRWKMASQSGRETPRAADDETDATLGDVAAPGHPLLEDYVRRFPELGPLDDVADDLVIGEYKARWLAGEHPSHDEYSERFPQRRESLGDLLKRVDSELAGKDGQNALDRKAGQGPLGAAIAENQSAIGCPHCHHPVEVVVDAGSDAIICESCGSPFNMIIDETLSYAQEEVRTIGHFQVKEKLGSGAFGTVWLAIDTKLDRTVAVKVPREGQLESPESEQFLREARAAAQLQHPNIVSVHEVGREDDSFYIVSDYVQGVTVADWLTAGQRMGFREAVEFCAKTAEALEHAHRAGVIHRDLKPSNIMIDADRQPHVMDFGLAKREAGETTMTMDGKVLGTPAYMSPEQARGEAHHVDGTADVYSLGVILFELLTGERPFRGNMRMLLHQVMTQEPPRPRSFNADIPRDLENVCLKCLEKDPRKRYASAQELADDLRRFLAGEAVLARPITAAARAWRRCARHPVVATLSLGLFMTVAILAIGGPIEAMHQNSLRIKADRATAAAEGQTERARALAHAEFVAREEYRRELYLSDMNLVPQAWESADGDCLRQTLERHVPKAGETDLRGFEWHVWNRLTSRHVQEFVAEQQALTCLAYSPNGKMLALGDDAGGVWTADLATGQMKRQADHEHTVQCMAFSPDGNLLVYGRRHGELTFWDTVQQKCLKIIDTGELGVKALAFSPDGSLLAAGAGRLGLVWNSPKCPIKIWEVSTGRFRRELSGHGKQVNGLSFSPDGNSLASSGLDGILRIWDLTQNDENVLFEGDGASHAVAFSADGERVVSADGERLRIWNVATRTCERVLSGEHTETILSVACSPDGKFLATGGNDWRVCVWNAQDGQILARFRGHPYAVRAVAFSPDSQFLATAGGNSVKIWPMNTIGRDVLRGHDGRVNHVRFLGGQKRLISAGSDGVIQVWDVAASTPLETLVKRKESIRAFALAPDETLLAYDGPDNSVQLFDLETNKPTRKLVGHDKIVSRLAFSPDGNVLISLSGDKSAILWRLHDGILVNKLPDATVRPTAVTFSPDGNLLGIASKRCCVGLFDAGAEESLGRLKGHYGWITTATFSPDGRLVASGSVDRTVRLWDVRERRETAKLWGYDSAIHSLAFSPKHAVLAAGDENGRIGLWDLKTFRKITTLLGHVGTVRTLAFSKDGKILASGGSDGTIRLWRGHQE